MSRDRKKRHRNPPVEYRFKPGQSGNPKGRPPGRKNWKTIIGEELDRLITNAPLKGRPCVRRMVARGQIARAMKGSAASAEWLIKHGPSDPGQGGEGMFDGIFGNPFGG